MFKKSKDKDVDITSLNHILHTGKKLINIGYFMAIVCLILLGTYLIKEWNILKYIGEFLKVEFFNGEDSLLDLITFLKIRRLSSYSYHMLYARLLYPSYYFDVYEDVMNNNGDEERLVTIISKVQDYEFFLKKAYEEINKYTHLEKIDWLIKKEL